MLSDYELTARLSGDDAFELRRGRRTQTAAPVLLKLSRAEAPRAADAAALRRECALAAELSSAATLLPRLVESRQRTALVMEDPGGNLLSSARHAPRLPFDVVASIGTQLAETLSELHARGVVHAGLRPAAVLCDTDTPRAWLIDFADVRGPSPSDVPAGRSAERLIYTAPEQTGRIDRTVDHRADLYALGALLYELLCGAPPFESDDALELIHRHLAAEPIAPSERDPRVPAALSAVVMRLLAKSPDERYQTANGVAHDLRRCADDWSRYARIHPFTLGERDASGQLSFATKLYGREHEVELLLAAFERACAGWSGPGEMVLVEGPAGTGKTALIQQLVRPIVRRRGYFIAGKFDQVARGIPFGALVQAFRGLVQQLLTEPEAQLTAWRNALTETLGSNGGVLAEVMPEIQFVIGPQSAPPQLGAIEAHNRFQRVLQNFLSALARPDHPLVLFLDDLQWADDATLDLLEPLLANAQNHCLLLLGACRQAEAQASPRLLEALTSLQSAGVPLLRIALGPLQPPDLTALVADTLRYGPADAEPLAQVIGRKTGGNPLFVTQFLKSLEREGFLRFDANEARWRYRVDDIANAPIAADVIELMTRNIQRLPPKSQYALTLAACIGNRFDRATLAIVSEQTPAQADRDLLPALDEGLLVAFAPARTAGVDADDGAGDSSGTHYAFLHDRVQQAAYALIPPERRQMVHLTVGRLLLSRTPRERLDTRRFEIVQHLNLGRTLISTRQERFSVATLDLDAGRKAKSSTAHDTALELFLAGIDLLDEAAWDNEHALAFELHLEAAESRYLCGQFDQALLDFARLLAQARTPVERARVIRLRIVQLENMGRYHESIAAARDGIAMFGVSFPDDEDTKLSALDDEIGAIDRLRGERSVASLQDLPLMTDPQVRMLASMLTDIWASAYIIGDPALARLISATLVRLSLQHGNVEESAYGYVTHAITVGAMRGDYAQAYEYGRLALAVNARLADTRRRAKIYQQFHAHVNFWCQPYDTCAAYAREACRAGLDSGDFLYAAYGAGTEPWAAMMAAQDLAAFERHHEPSVALIERLNNRGFADSVRLLVNWSRALQGRTRAPLSLTDATFDEAAFLETYRDNPFFCTIHAVAKLQLCSLLGTADQALAAARDAEALIKNLPGTIWPLMFDFWHALALAGNWQEAGEADRAAWLTELSAAQARFDALAEHCAQNFQCQALLLAAEIARIEDRDDAALALFGQAIEFADIHPLLPLGALANELCGRHLVRGGKTALGRMHLAQARASYVRWGAHAKVQAMQTQYPILAARGSSSSSVPASAEDDATRQTLAAPTPEGGLDLYSVVKAAQAIAGETQVDALLSRLMRIAIENAGAQRGALTLETESGPVVHAVSGLDSLPAVPALPLEQASNVPVGIVNYVRRTSMSLVLTQSEIDEHHASDPYIARCQPRSVMCVPALHQGRLVGVLYLENCQVSGAFTADRARVLQSLAAQAAIALENARLHRELEAENSFLRRDLIANVSHDLRTPLVSIRGYLELLAATGPSLNDTQRRSYLETAVRQSEHLGVLIDELFELAKLDFKGLTLQCEEFQIGELASDVLQKFRLMAAGKPIELVLEAMPGLPAVRADLSLIERVLDNLLGNALKHTPAGGCVKVHLRADEQCVGVSVIDNGVGIAPADLPHIFDRFYRGQPASNERSCDARGTGLGLAIARRILELHGQSIDVESDANGSTFRFTLPAA
jgi:predicted ATPase/signal transduction histidine kinase